jgi:signal transduction histidine kinase/ActR/RegA family two-component response regulator
MQRDLDGVDAELQALRAEVTRLRRTNEVLVRQVERAADSLGGGFSMFQTAILLENTVRERTHDLQQALDRLTTANEELSHAMRAADAANRAKSEFLATISHEIRTPLNGIIGFADLLSATELAEEQRSYLDLIRTAGEALLSVVSDVLDFSKIEAGQLKLERDPFDPSALVWTVHALFGQHVASKGLQMRVRVGAGVPSLATGDAGRVQQVLLNLVGNAVKFTEAGAVELSVETGLSPTGAPVLAFRVVDSGIGVPFERQDRLFRAFSQADGSVTRRYGGTGLGLAISRQLVELMGGRIGVESIEGRGSTFWFEIPLFVAEDRVAADGAIAARTPRQYDARVLVAEDNPVGQMLVQRHLERMGCVVDVVANGRLAVEAVRTGTYNLVLMDCQMPELDGISAAREIRSLPSTAGLVPIVALTANAVAGDREVCFGAGMDDYLAKPVRLAQLTAALDRWLVRTDDERGQAR